MQKGISFLRKVVYIGVGALFLLAVGLPSTKSRIGLAAGVAWLALALVCFWHGSRFGRIAAVILVVLGVVLFRVLT